MTTITVGYTSDEIRAFVFEYERQPWGTRLDWLAEHGISRDRFRKWRNTVFDGDLDAGLIPRDGSPMTSANMRRRLTRDQFHKEAENEKLRARIRELEQTNEALGKAIGLLHQLNEQEPDTPETSDPNNS